MPWKLADLFYDQLTTQIKEEIDMKSKTLAVALAKAEKEDEVLSILKKAGFWDDYKYWKPYGGYDNNYSIIGNQQNSADASFVEKVINSIDAVLIKECLVRGIDITGYDAPKSMAEAADTFFGVKNGQLALVPARKRTEIAQNIIIAATGDKSGQLNLSIVDRGEGQTPKRMLETILSIGKSNKLRVPFVQGKFNMGGTGALPFCGEHNLQLVISKRCPDIPNDGTDPSFDKWSVTIIRREDAREGRRSCMYTYLTDENGEILTIDSNTLPIIPTCFIKGQHETTYEDMNFGTYIKLYNYQLTGYKTSIVLDFYNRLSLLIPGLALPIRMRECREYNANTNESTASGLITRLYDDRSQKIEENFPTSSTFTVDGQKVKCSVYLFKKEEDTNGRQNKLKKNEGELFIVNGQTQGIILNSIFSRLNLSYIKDSIIVMVDCSELDIPHQEKLFMTSRDRIRTSDFSKELTVAIEAYLEDHQGLKQAEYNRRTEALKNKLADNKPFKSMLQDILKKSTVLSKIFLAGTTLQSPLNSAGAAGNSEQDDYEGKLHPTFFKLKGKMQKGNLTKHVAINRNFRVQFETDVQNDYFYRPIESGCLILKIDGAVREDLISSCNLLNGTATLTISMPQDAKVGDTHIFETAIQDEYIAQSFENSFTMIVESADETTSSGLGNRQKPADPDRKGNRIYPSGLAIPEIITVEMDEWERYNMDRFSALVYVSTENGGDYYLNMHNDYLLTELKGLRDQNRIELTRARYTYSMALIGMSIISFYKSNEAVASEVDVSAEVKKISTIISPILIPMLESMAALDDGDLRPAA